MLFRGVADGTTFNRELFDTDCLSIGNPKVNMRIQVAHVLSALPLGL